MATTTASDNGPAAHRRSVLQVVADGARGGGTTVVLALIDELRADNWDVHLATQAGSDLASLAEERGVAVHPFDFMSRRVDRTLTNGIDALTRAISPSVVHLHGSRAGFLARKRPSRTPTIYTVHGYHFEQRSLASKALSIVAERLATRRIDLLTFVGERDKRYNERLHLSPKRIPTAVIRNGVRVGPLDHQHDGPLRRLCFVGRLVEQKDPILAIQALSHLDPAVRLSVIGDGPLRDAAMSEARRLGVGDRVEFLGALPGPEVAHVLRNADALVMTSRWEGLPIVPLEAMALGTPVVANDLSPLREIIPSELEGRLVAGRDPQELALAIAALNDDGLRRTIATCAYDRVCSEFSWSAAWSRYREHYEQQANRGPR